MTKARRYLCMPASGLTYEVRAPIQPGEHPHEYAVDLDKKTCTCHVFQAQGFPCIHATKVVLYRRDPIENYVDELSKSLHISEPMKEAYFHVPQLRMLKLCQHSLCWRTQMTIQASQATKMMH